MYQAPFPYRSKTFKSEHQDHNPRKALILAPKYSASFKPLQTFSDCILSCAVRLPGVIVLEHVAFIVLEPLPINPTFTAPLHCCHIDCKKNSKSRPRSAFRALLLALNWGPDCGPKKGTSAACVNMAGPKNGDEICTQKRNPESPQLLAPCWTNCGHKNCETSSQRRIKPQLEKDAAFSLTRLAKRIFCMSPT